VGWYNRIGKTNDKRGEYPASLTSRVAISVNGVKMTEQTVDRTQQMFTYRADETGPLTILITTGDIRKKIEVTVKESQIYIDQQ